MSFIETLKQDAIEAQKKHFKKTLIRHLQQNPETTLLELATQLQLTEELASSFLVSDIFHVPVAKVQITKLRRQELAEALYTWLKTNHASGISRQDLKEAYQDNEQVSDHFGSLLGLLRNMKRIEIDGRGKEQKIKPVVVNLSKVKKA